MSTDPFSSLRFKEYRLCIGARLTLTIGFQIQAIIISWIAYEQTKDPWTLGLMGLMEAIPIVVVSLFGGHFADKNNRRTIILCCIGLLMAGSLFLTWYTSDHLIHLQNYGVNPLYALIFLVGAARGFLEPAVNAFATQLIPFSLYANAATWSSSVWQLGAVIGPAAGGLLYAWIGPSDAALFSFLMMFSAALFYFFIRSKPFKPTNSHESIWQSLREGIRFVARKQVILSAITLDMFAVFFGGAVAMLPVFAEEILHVGPEGLGYLRTAPALGAVIMAIIQAYYPPVKNSGKLMLINVGLFGVSMILFAVSTNFWLSFSLLLLSGMFDNVSVVIRLTIIQSFTPNEMRGRVSSVNSIFVGASNEIGAFESGLAARLMKLIPSVIFGGVMTVLVVMATSKFAPKLRELHLKDVLNH
ncbi:MAG: MFS transporter [Bacteroidia bacterium]|nr:MFS transporter [Bacteroidia bacterium]